MSAFSSAPGITTSEVTQLIEANNVKMLATVYQAIKDSTEESRKLHQALVEESRKMHQALADSAEKSRKSNEDATRALKDVLDVVRGIAEASHGDRTDRNERTGVESRRRPQVDLFLSVRNKREVIEIAKKHRWCRLTHTMKKEAMAEALVKDGVYDLMVENGFVRAV